MQVNSWPEPWPQQTIAWGSLGRLIRPLPPSITLTSATHRGFWRRRFRSRSRAYRPKVRLAVLGRVPSPAKLLPKQLRHILRRRFFRSSRLCRRFVRARSEEHTSELQSLIHISFDVFYLKKKTNEINR